MVHIPSISWTQCTLPVHNYTPCRFLSFVLFVCWVPLLGPSFLPPPFLIPPFPPSYLFSFVLLPFLHFSSHFFPLSCFLPSILLFLPSILSSVPPLKLPRSSVLRSRFLPLLPSSVPFHAPPPFIPPFFHSTFFLSSFPAFLSKNLPIFLCPPFLLSFPPAILPSSLSSLLYCTTYLLLLPRQKQGWEFAHWLLSLKSNEQQ